MRKQGAFFLALLLCAAPAVSWAAQPYLKETQSHPLLGVGIRVDVCFVDGRQDDVRAALDRIWKRLEDLQSHTDIDGPASDVAALNSARGEPVKVHEDVYRLLIAVREIVVRSDGIFDITVAPLADMWQRAGREGAYPSLKAITEAKTHIGIDKLEIRGNGVVRLPDPASRIDLSGLVAGFGADEAVRILREAHFFNFMISAGSGLYVAGTDCRGGPWRIGVKDPDHHEKILDVIELSDAAVGSSGDNEDPIVIQGKHWAHIINAMTGYPQNGVANATVIAPTVLEAGALSQALCLLGPHQGVRLIRGMGEKYDALLLFRRGVDSYEWHSTAGYEDRRVSQTE